MASSTTTLTNLMPILYDTRFLERAKIMLCYDYGADKKNMPLNSGKTVYFNRFSPLAVQTTPLTECTTPTALDMTTTIVSATIAEYGGYVQACSLFEMTSIDDNLMEHIDVIGQNAGETIDTLIRNTLAACGTVQLANGKSSITAVATTDTITGAEIRKAVRTLCVNKAYRFADGFFRSVIPCNAVYDLRGNSEWLDAFRYTDATPIRNGEVGTLHGVKFCETNNPFIQTASGASSADIYSTFVFGAHAYAMINLEGQPGTRVIVKQSGPTDTSNPLDMYGTVGWKAFFASVCLNSSWIIRIESGVSS